LRQSHKTILIWLILIVVFVSIYSLFNDSSSKSDSMDMKAFRALLSNTEQRSFIQRIKIEPGARDEAKYVIGHNLVVDGGFTVGKPINVRPAR
jgi:hypothetical protein